MTKLNIHEAKTHLSKYLAKVQQGETIIICKNDLPIAQLIPIPQKKRDLKKIFGIGKNYIINMDHFDDPLTDEDLPEMGL